MPSTENGVDGSGSDGLLPDTGEAHLLFAEEGPPPPSGQSGNSPAVELPTHFPTTVADEPMLLRGNIPVTVQYAEAVLAAAQPRTWWQRILRWFKRKP